MFGERLKKAREMRSLRQKDLALMVNVSQQTIAAYEVGRTTPTPDLIGMFASVLHVPVSWLLEAEETYTPEEIELINAYRRLDERGKRAVKALIASI